MIINLLNHRKLEDLVRIRAEVGLLVHLTLTKLVEFAEKHQTTPPKLLLMNAVAAGKDISAIAANDGSSKYLAGGLINYHQKQSDKTTLDQNPEDRVHAIFEFWDQAGIPDFTLIAGGDGFTSGPKAESLLVYAGTRDQIISQVFNAEVNEIIGSPEHRTALQEVAAIATLQQLLEICGVQPMDIRKRIEEIEGSSIEEENLFLIKSYDVEKINRASWRKLIPFIQAYVQDNPNHKISIGESFTSGILTDILTSNENGTSILDLSLNWYDSKLKEYVGVPKGHLKEDLIAEPSTIAMATAGLLKIAPLTTDIALGTTGYANYSVKGKPDYFSIGLAHRKAPDDSEEGINVSTARVEVTISQEDGRSKGRRQLTRHLGASTALLMLVKKLSEIFPDEKFETIQQQLLDVIEDNGTIRFQTFRVIQDDETGKWQIVDETIKD